MLQRQNHQLIIRVDYTVAYHYLILMMKRSGFFRKLCSPGLARESKKALRQYLQL